MRFARARLMVALLLLFAWVGYVAYQAMAFGRFPVVSHAQLLTSRLDVIADVSMDDQGKPSPIVHVVEVHWPAGKKDLAGQELTVVNLPDPFVQGFAGAGRYILPLAPSDNGAYRIAGLPRSPGFDQSALFVYPDTPLTRQQLDKIPKPPTAN
jgi:hypothetical protein